MFECIKYLYGGLKDPSKKDLTSYSRFSQQIYIIPGLTPGQNSTDFNKTRIKPKWIWGAEAEI